MFCCVLANELPRFRWRASGGVDKKPHGTLRRPGQCGHDPASDLQPKIPDLRIREQVNHWLRFMRTRLGVWVEGGPGSSLPKQCLVEGSIGCRAQDQRGCSCRPQRSQEPKCQHQLQPRSWMTDVLCKMASHPCQLPGAARGMNVYNIRYLARPLRPWRRQNAKTIKPGDWCANADAMHLAQPRPCSYDMAGEVHLLHVTT
jgi:hypothetical protein